LSDTPSPTVRLKRVCFVTHTPALFGANLSMLTTIKGLREHGVETVVVHPPGKALADILKELEILALPMVVPEWTHPVEKETSLGALGRSLLRRVEFAKHRRLAKYLVGEASGWVKAQRVDAVWSNSIVTGLGYHLAKELGLPHIWHVRESMTDFALAFNEGASGMRKAFARTQLGIGVSRFIADYYAGLAPPDRIQPLYDALGSADELASRPVRKERSMHGHLLMVGYIQEAKGQRQAVEAVSQLTEAFPDVTLTIVGTGEMGLVKEQVDKFGLEDRVKFAGYQADTKPFYVDADAFLMCSRGEAMGRVTVEAMVQGLPVVGRNAGATVELIGANERGLLYDGSTASLVAAVKTSLIDAGGTRGRTERARQFALREFTTERHLQGLTEALHNAGFRLP